jgi:hypothetical protein
MNNKLFKVVVVVVAMVSIMGCATNFTERSSTLDGEITAFGSVVLDNVVKLSDLDNLGLVEVQRTVRYTLQNNGDYTIEMDGYSFSYTRSSNQSVEQGTRVIGLLNYSSFGGFEAEAASGGFLSGVFGGRSSSAPAATNQVPRAVQTTPRQFAIDAVNFDLLTRAAELGGMALLLPEYSWAIEEETTGRDNAGFLFIAPSRVYETRTTVYTLTGRATVVSF